MNKFLKNKILYAILVILCIVLLVYLNLSGFDKIKYNKAVELVGVGDYEEAISLFEELDIDVSDEIKDVKYLYAIQCVEDENIGQAKKLLDEIGEYKDSNSLGYEVTYIEAGKVACNDGILEALPLYETLPSDYKDVAEIIDKINEWKVYVGTWSEYSPYLEDTFVMNYNIFFEGDRVYCRADNWRIDLDKLEIVNNEAKFSFHSMTFFVDGMIIDYDGEEFTKIVKGSGANRNNMITSKNSSTFGVNIRDTIKGTTNPDADDYYENANAGAIIADKEKEYNDLVNEMNTPKEPAIGMTASEVEKSTWGKPNEINKTTYEWGTTEQWCYSNYRYIYFKNGVVTAISE